MTDEQLIESLGGAARLAELLHYDKEGGVQRVHNWIKRGIPARVKLERPDLFLTNPAVKRQKQKATASGRHEHASAKRGSDRPSNYREER